MATRVGAAAVTAGLLLPPVVAGASSASAGGEGVVRGGVEAAAAGDPSWLAEINRYRIGAGLAAVADEPSWDAGLQAHLRYLASTPASDLSGPYQSLHTENPASAYFSAMGAHEAASSELVTGGATGSAVSVIDRWLQAPFHAVGMLRPNLRQVAFAQDPVTGDAALDVATGLDPAAPPDPSPVLFPGPGLLTNLTTLGAESPDPLETCGWSGTPAGVPLVALLPSDPSPGLAASLVEPDGTVDTTANGGLCVVDDHTYRSSNAVYGQEGAAILSNDHAVFLIPRHPLAGGGTNVAIQATITQPGQGPITWSFSEAATLPGTATGMASTPDGRGYWLVDGAGQVSNHGDAGYYGSTMGHSLNSPISHIVATPDGGGYWLVAADGGIFTFGDAGFYGSMGASHLNAPVVAIGSGGRAGGYWEVGSDGGIFAFGVPFLGSTGNIGLNRPINGMAVTPDGGGYVLVASDGGIFNFGDAGFAGSTGNLALAAPIVGVAMGPTNAGYWLAGGDGSVFSFGVPFLGGD